MKIHLKTRGMAFLAIVALFAPIATLSAQVVGLGVGATVGKKPPPTSPVTGNAANGKTLFFEYSCYACHGYNGETGARAFVGNWGNLATEQTFITFLRGRANIAPPTPTTTMPNFAESTMSDQRAKDIYAYIRTFKSNAPELKDIPTLNVIIESVKQGK